MTKFTQVTIVCNKEHEIVEGSCALCERDKAQHNARRYRTLREMIGVLNVEIGRIIGLKEHSFLNMTAEGMRQTLDEALDSRADKLERPEGDRNGTETHMLEQTGPTESAAPQGQLAMETTASRVAPADAADAWTPWPGAVADDVIAQVKLRDGSEEMREAGSLDWSHQNSDGDIIAYRIAKLEGTVPLRWPADEKTPRSTPGIVPRNQVLEALMLSQIVLCQWTDLYARLQNESGEVVSRKLDYNLPPGSHVRALEAIEDAMKHFKDTPPAAVLDRAYRAYEYQHTPEREAARIERSRAAFAAPAQPAMSINTGKHSPAGVAESQAPSIRDGDAGVAPDRSAASPAPASAPKDARDAAPEHAGYADEDEHFGKTIKDYVDERLQTDPEEMVIGFEFEVNHIYSRSEQWRVKSGPTMENPEQPTEVERIDAALSREEPANAK